MVGDFLEGRSAKAESAFLNAYKLAMMFEKPEDALRYLQKFSQQFPTNKQILHDACLFNMPEDDNWDVKNWQKMCGRYLYRSDFRNSPALPMASKIPLEKILEENDLKSASLPDPDKPKGQRFLKGILATVINAQYPRANEEPLAAEIFSKCQTEGTYIPESVFNRWLDEIKPKLRSGTRRLIINIDYVKIDPIQLNDGSDPINKTV